uniref:Uncharacterized protein n=1 Tax=Solanum tuberosum TaxID=4113 RepID=M1DMC4_SOLTU
MVDTCIGSCVCITQTSTLNCDADDFNRLKDKPPYTDIRHTLCGVEGWNVFEKVQVHEKMSGQRLAEVVDESDWDCRWTQQILSSESVKLGEPMHNSMTPTLFAVWTPTSTGGPV